METSPPSHQNPPRIHVGSRLPHLLLMGACTGIFLGGVLRQLGVGRATAPPLVRAPPIPSAKPETQAPELPTSDWKIIEVTSSPGDPRQPRPKLIIRWAEPVRASLVLVRTGHPDELLYRHAEPTNQITARMPALPAGENAELLLQNLKTNAAHRYSVLGRPFRGEPYVSAEAGLQGIRSIEGGAVVLGPGSRLRRFQGAELLASHQAKESLTGVSISQRGHLVAMDVRGRLHGYRLTDLGHAWQHHPVHPSSLQPSLLPPYQLVLTTPITPLRRPALTCLEASSGIPMWKAPLVLPVPLAPATRGTAGHRFVIATLQGARAVAYNVFGEGPRLDIAELLPAEFSASAALSPRNQWAAFGAKDGHIRTLHLKGRTATADQAAATSPAPIAGEIELQLGIDPVRQLTFLDENTLLVLRDHEVLLLKRDGAVRWQTHLTSPADFGPAFAGEHVFLGLQEGVVLTLARRDGEVLERREVGPLLPGSLEPGPGPIVWASQKGGAVRIADPGHPVLPHVSAGPLSK